MVMSDTSSMIDGFTITLLTVEFGQVWARFDVEKCAKCIRLCKPGFTKSHTTLDIDNELWKQNCIRL